jgi:hypothetical protein
MITANQDYQCHIEILRDCDGHNYAQRVAMAQPIQKAAGVLNRALEEWNEVRKNLSYKTMTLNEVRAENMLSWVYDGTSSSENKT